MARDLLDPADLARAAERLASLVPGYAGYKHSERRSDDDRAVRDAVVRQLGLLLGRLERALRVSIRSLAPEDAEKSEAILRGVCRHRDRIRFAPAGNASLFSRSTIQNGDVERLVSLDAALWSALEELDRVAAEWDQGSRSGDTSWPGNELHDAMIELESVLDERESFLRS